MVWKIPNLWPELVTQGMPVSPRAILQRQAQILSERAENAVRGEIASRMLGSDLVHSLFIVAPEMEGLHYLIVRVRHHMQHPYPLHIFTSESDNTGMECGDELEFIEALRGVLSSPRVMNVVSSLLSQLSAAAV